MMKLAICKFRSEPRKIFIYLVLTILSVLSLSACGPKAEIHPGFDPFGSRLIAVLPLKEENAIARERSDALQRLLVSELRNSGYVVLEPEVLSLSQTSSSPVGYYYLSRRYGIKTLAQLEISSLSENDFILGYYNTLSGKLRLLEPSGAVTVEVEHRESQRGGVVFQTGQIVQGISEQVANASGENATFLVSRFVRRVVRELPVVEGQDSDIEVLQAIVAEPEVELRNNDVAHKCVNGTADSLATVTIGKQTSGLREVTPGRYCTILRVKEFIQRDAKAHVELRTPFGSKQRAKFRLSM
jgi:hypothetical protein